jgi:hypothetical protein
MFLVYLKPLAWTQHIKSYPNLKVESLSLEATCKPHTNCDLLMSNGVKLLDFEFPLAIIEGEPRADDLADARLPAEALGGVWFIEDQNFLHGWFYLKSNGFTAVWDLVREGGYLDCRIDLTVDSNRQGVQAISTRARPTWDIAKPLPISDIGIQFTRMPNADEPRQARRRGWFSSR